MVLGETEVAQTVEPVKLPPEEEKPKDWEEELMSTCFQKHFAIRRDNCIVYHYPMNPVYIRLPAPLEELGYFSMEMIIPEGFSSVGWMFSKSTDTQGAWNNMELRKFGEDIRVTVMDVVNGKEIKYPWHNSNIGGVSPMFQNQLETFVRFAYDNPTKELVTTVNGFEYLRHPMACGGEANEFTLYGDVFIPDLTIPCKDMGTPFTVHLNGPVLYNDKYTIKFIPKPPAKILTATFGDIIIAVDLEKHKELLSENGPCQLEISSHSNCAFVELGGKTIQEIWRRLVTPQVVIDGDVVIKRITISKG